MTDTDKTPEIIIEAVGTPVAHVARGMNVAPHPGVEFPTDTPEHFTSEERIQHEESIAHNKEIEEHTQAMLAQHEEAQDSGGPHISVIVRVDGYAMGMALDTQTLPDTFLEDPQAHVDHITEHVLKAYNARPQPLNNGS